MEVEAFLETLAQLQRRDIPQRKVTPWEQHPLRNSSAMKGPIIVSLQATGWSNPVYPACWAGLRNCAPLALRFFILPRPPDFSNVPRMAKKISSVPATITVHYTRIIVPLMVREILDEEIARKLV